MPDNLTREQRSFCMSRVRGKDTGPERLVRRMLHARGLRFRKHVAGIPGRPDIVFPARRVVVFIDGDFWHGFSYPRWCDGLTDFWRTKIDTNRARDRRTNRRLRRLGWRVLRIWEHDIERDAQVCVERIMNYLGHGS